MLLYKENPCNNLFLRVGKPKRKILIERQLIKLDFFLSEVLKKFTKSIEAPVVYQALVNTFRFTGIRQTQLLRLKIGDVDLYQKVIHISPELIKIMNIIVFLLWLVSYSLILN